MCQPDPRERQALTTQTEQLSSLLSQGMQQQPHHQRGGPRPLVLWSSQTNPRHLAAGQPLGPCVLSAALRGGGAVRTPASSLLPSGLAIPRCRELPKGEEDSCNPHSPIQSLTRATLHGSHELTCGRGAVAARVFIQKAKQSPLAAEQAAPSGDQLLRRALYKLRQAAAGSPGRCSAGLCEQEPA